MLAPLCSPAQKKRRTYVVCLTIAMQSGALPSVERASILPDIAQIESRGSTSTIVMLIQFHMTLRSQNLHMPCPSRRGDEASKIVRTVGAFSVSAERERNRCVLRSWHERLLARYLYLRRHCDRHACYCSEALHVETSDEGSKRALFTWICCVPHARGLRSFSNTN